MKNPKTEIIYIGFKNIIEGPIKSVIIKQSKDVKFLEKSTKVLIRSP